MTKTSTFSSQANCPSKTLSSSLSIMFPYSVYSRLSNLFLINSDCSSLVKSDEPVCEDSKWNLICPLVGSEGNGFCRSAFIAQTIYTSSSPNMREADPNACGIVPSSILYYLWSRLPRPSLLVPSFNPSEINIFSFSQIYCFILTYLLLV